MTTTELSASWPDCTLGPPWPFFDVSAVSGSIVGEAVARGADWAESLPGLDCGSGVDVEAGEQPATASAHVPTPARKTAGLFMDIACSNACRSGEGTAFVACPVDSTIAATGPGTTRGEWARACQWMLSD